MVVYILSNPSYKEGIYKIGYSKEVNERMNQLWSTGVPTPFQKELVIEGTEIQEHLLHDDLENKRINTNREFFKLDMYDFNRIFSIYSKQIQYISPQLFKKYYDSVEVDIIKQLIINTPLSAEVQSKDIHHLEELYPHIRKYMFTGISSERHKFKSKCTAWMAIYVCSPDGPYGIGYPWDYWDLLKSASNGEFNYPFSTLDAINSVEELIETGFIKIENDVVTVLKLFDSGN